MSDSQPCSACVHTSESRMEDVPMYRYSNPLPVCDGSCTREHCRPCCFSGQWEQVLPALNYQNQLLVDILGAVNSLTAALLANRIR